MNCSSISCLIKRKRLSYRNDFGNSKPSCFSCQSCIFFKKNCLFNFLKLRRQKIINQRITGLKWIAFLIYFRQKSGATVKSNLSLSFLIRISYFWKISSMPISSLLFLRLLSNIKCWNISALHILKQLQFTLT